MHGEVFISLLVEYCTGICRTWRSHQKRRSHQ